MAPLFDMTSYNHLLNDLLSTITSWSLLFFRSLRQRQRRDAEASADVHDLSLQGLIVADVDAFLVFFRP